MIVNTKSSLTKAIILLLIVTLESFSNAPYPTEIGTNTKNNYYKTPKGLVIDWSDSHKLKQSDFMAKRKGSSGFAVATTASAFGYSIVNDNGTISGSIYVRFYCDSSWWNPEYKVSDIQDEILDHEQLHFDICELFGRKLFKEMVSLRKSGRSNGNNIDRMHTRLERQYSQYQDKYDKETNHSIDRTAQKKWDKKVKKELHELAEYANYSNF
jgi:uncharacterized protein DUF922